jgi:hypothetical protein
MEKEKGYGQYPNRPSVIKADWRVHSSVLSIPFQVDFYAIMAFSAKASEARPRPHDP